MTGIADIPEIRALNSRTSLIRIPEEINVPITDRVRRLIDTAAMRRLTRISQLGMVSLVYPGATHSRFEHSLGVYRLALLYLAQLGTDDSFAAAVTVREAEAFVVAALLHDVGHWPFCHPIEDLRIPSVPRHESLAERSIAEQEISRILRDEFGLEPGHVLRLLAGRPQTTGEVILSSLLSGPVDVDKMDYLARDSLHAGVPYGRHFDWQRLLGSLCLGRDGRSLAITDKGRTAAEMLVFARYIMFSEVYWHHAVRSATAMLQRAFYELFERIDLGHVLQATDSSFVETLRQAARRHHAGPLVEGLFGDRRSLYKRWLEFSYSSRPAIYRQFAQRPYSFLVDTARRFAEKLSRRVGRSIPAVAVLIDAPPADLEIQFELDVRCAEEGGYRQLAELSPVVHALATTQFDDFVKKVRLFVAPDCRAALQPDEAIELLMSAADAADAD
jgi:HD superfamily phosphohydrolase